MRIRILNKKCIKCGKDLNTRNIYTASIKKHDYVCKKCSYLRVSKFSFQKKKEFSSRLKINGCAIGGYNKCDKALEFHHVNPGDKKFYVNSNLVYQHKITNSMVVEELNKCILLCANCHREIHT